MRRHEPDHGSIRAAKRAQPKELWQSGDPFMRYLLAFFLGGLLSVVTITNPVSKVPLFLALASDMNVAKHNDQA
jgi:hypothetical protein